MQLIFILLDLVLAVGTVEELYGTFICNSIKRRGCPIVPDDKRAMGSTLRSELCISRNANQNIISLFYNV